MKLPNRYGGGNEDSKIAQVRYWSNVGGYGISPDILELTGFWSESLLEKLRDLGTDTSQSIQQIYGGIVKFQPLPGKRWEVEFDAVMDAINRILQIKRHVNDMIDWIPKLLNEEWHSSDISYLPEELPEEIKKMIISPRKYVIAEDPMIARQILAVMPVLNGLKNRIGYFSGIYWKANTLFGRMVLEGVHYAMKNMSIRDFPQPDVLSLEELADHAAMIISESGQ